ncbi:MAG: response regulator transcription factor [Acidimicrobiales bacterium]
MKVLVVEDQRELAEAVARGLRQQGMTVDIALDGQDAFDHVLDHASLVTYDVVVLDRGLPKVHGDDVCRTLAASGCNSRILMLTAASTVEDKVEGLGLGADDYLAKPFSFAELVARVRALGRRANPASPLCLVHGNLELDPARRVALRGGARLALTPKEFAVLELLLNARGAAVSAEELLERVWDEYADPFSSTVKVTVGRLRAKLGDPPLIETAPRTGYRLAPET